MVMCNWVQSISTAPLRTFCEVVSSLLLFLSWTLVEKGPSHCRNLYNCKIQLSRLSP